MQESSRAHGREREREGERGGIGGGGGGGEKIDPDCDDLSVRRNRGILRARISLVNTIVQW